MRAPRSLIRMEKVINLLRHCLADTADRLDVSDPGSGNSAGRAEVLQQGALSRRTDSRNLVEGIGADRLGALLPVTADGESVRLVAQPLEVVEHRAAQIEAERLLAWHVEMLAAGIAVGTFRDADQRHILDA